MRPLVRSTINDVLVRVENEASHAAIAILMGNEVFTPWVRAPMVWPYNGNTMSILDLFLAAISLAPVGLFLLFWRMFPHDSGIHPIYRDSRLNDTQKDRGL
jgi:hypothetical protein